MQVNIDYNDNNHKYLVINNWIRSYNCDRKKSNSNSTTV